MRQRQWVGLVSGLLLLAASGCSVKQQQEVLGSIGTIIPGSRNSIFGSGAPGNGVEQTLVAPASAHVDPERTDAQLVLKTLQQAMTDNPPPFQECLDDPQCRLAFTTHLVRLQKQALSSIELPTVYDRYDLKRGKE